MNNILKIFFDEKRVASIEIQAETKERELELEQLAVRFLETLSNDDAN